jgi:hypothetical protein
MVCDTSTFCLIPGRNGLFLAPWVAVTHMPTPTPTPPTPSADRRPVPFRAGSAPVPHARWASVRVSALAAGVSAAGLGLGVPATIVLVLWIGSPYPDGGLGGALHISADLWLLAQGAELLRAHTFPGPPAPVAVAPLLLSAVPAWLVFRGTSSAVTGGDGDQEDDDTGGGIHRSGARRPAPTVREAATVAGWVLAGYLTVGAVATAYATSGGPVRVAPLTALYVPLFAAVAAACGAWSGSGRPPLDRWLRLPVPYGAEVVASLRAAGMAAGVLFGGGALLGAAALVWHEGAAGRTYAQLSGSCTGQVAVLMLALALVPNMAVWAASYALGTGFVVGVGSVVAPTGVSGVLPLPPFPLLAALPAGRAWTGWATLAVPVTAGCAVAWAVGNGGWSAWRTIRVACCSALLCGCGLAVAAAWAGGPLGSGAMAGFGPVWWLTGAAATAWTLVTALPGALVLRWHIGRPARGRLPGPRPPRPPGTRRSSRSRLRRDRERVPSASEARPDPVAVPDPVPDLLPPPSDPLPWPAAPPLPAFPPPLPNPPLPDPPPPANPPGGLPPGAPQDARQVAPKGLPRGLRTVPPTGLAPDAPRGGAPADLWNVPPGGSGERTAGGPHTGPREDRVDGGHDGLGSRPHTASRPDAPAGGRPDAPADGRPDAPAGGRPDAPAGGRPDGGADGRPDGPAGG